MDPTTPSPPSDVRLACGELEALVRPAYGGQVASLRFRGRELLDTGSPRSAARIDPDDYLSGGLGGIDDCLPAIAPGVHPTHRAPVPDHGELWYRAVELSGRTPRTVTLRTSGEQLPFTLERRMSLSPVALRVEYELAHTASGELALVWAAHPLLATSPGMSIVLGAPLTRAHATSPGVELTEGGRLRTTAGEADPGDWEALPAGTSAKLFGPWSGPVALVHPAWDVTLTIALDAPLKAHLGLWLNRAGFPAAAPVSHVAIEPTFGDSDELDAALARGTCLELGPHERVRWAVTYGVA